MSSGSFHWLDLAGRSYVVTGAASGIGVAIATSAGARGRARGTAGPRRRRLPSAPPRISARRAPRRSPWPATSPMRPPSVTPVSAAGANSVGERAGQQCRPAARGGLADVSVADWNAVLSVNLTGYLLCAREFWRDMREQPETAASSISPRSPHCIHRRAAAPTAPSKAGVLLMSRQMAAEWGPSGVRSNAICPGMIRTPLSAKFYEEPGFEARRAAVTASRRVGEPVDIAQSRIFLASPRSAYVNGAEFLVDGGLGCMLMDMVPRPGFNDRNSVATKSA